MGEVFRARDTRLDRTVAIKVLGSDLSADATLRKRFEREARAISALNHPNICALYDVGRENDVDYLVMELCDGRTLADRLAKGPLPLDEALEIGSEIAAALDRAHRSGVVHRDLKPANVILTAGGAKLVDFGIAKAAAELVDVDPSVPTRVRESEERALTQAGTILGTLQYMAPEQLEGGNVDARSDIFAFGALLYEMISGRRAFDGKSSATVIASVLEREPPPLSDVAPLTPAMLDRLIRACLQKSPDERWQSPHYLRRELEWIRDGIAPPSAPSRRGNRAAWIVAAAAMAAAIIAGTLLWMRGGEAPPLRRIVSAIVPPAGTSFVPVGDTAGAVELSPDGHFAAFVAAAGATRELWVESLDSGARRRIPGTAGAMFPFWSPDSRSIGFFAAGKLMAIDADGSALREIAEAPNARGGTWTSGGEIVFAPNTSSGLLRVRSTGGAAAPLTRSVAPYTTHRWPAVLPDQNHVVYVAAAHGSSEGETSIWIVPLGGGVERKLVASRGNAVPYRDYLLYLRGDHLVGQRIRDGALAGPVVTLWNRVLHDAGTWRSIFSVSQTGLLATYAALDTAEARLVRFDRTGKELGELGPATPSSDVAISPDGSKLVMTIGNPLSVLYVQDLGSGVRTRFSSATRVSLPVWSRDGSVIVFRQRTADGRFSIVAKAVDGTSPQRVLVSSATPIHPSAVDVERSRVIYTNMRGSDDWDLMTVPLSGGTPSLLIGGPGQQINAILSPDGRWLAYIEVGETGRAVMVTTYPQTGPKWTLVEDAASWLWWRDHASIDYQSGDGLLKSLPLEYEGSAVRAAAPVALFRLPPATANSVGMHVGAGGIVAVSVPRSDSGPATLVTNFDLPLYPR